MFGSFRWFILAVTIVTISAVPLDRPSVSDTNTTCNFDSNKQLDVDYSRFELAPQKKASVTPCLTERCGPRAASL